MDVLDTALKIGNMGGLALLAYFVLLELREQRREQRRGRAELEEQLTSLRARFDLFGTDLSVVADRVDPREISGAVSLPVAVARPRRTAPALGIPTTNGREERVDMSRVPRAAGARIRPRSVSDDPDDSDR